MSDNLSFEEVESNRKKWIDFLREDGRKKAVSALDAGNEERCCLGHGAYVIGVERHRDCGVNEEYSGLFAYGANCEISEAPEELIRKVGILDSVGSLRTSIDTGTGIH